MKKWITPAVFLCVLIAVWPTAQSQNPATRCSSCDVVHEALENVRQVKVGMTRKALEKYFVLDGGMSFRNRANYVHPKCDHLKIAVDFEPDPTVKSSLSPNDTVAAVSEVFVAYPVRD